MTNPLVEVIARMTGSSREKFRLSLQFDDSTIPVAALLDLVPYAVTGMAVYDAAGGFPYAPVDDEQVIYIRSGGLADPVAPRVDEQGSDIMGTGSITSPLYSPNGVFIRFGRAAEEGKRFLVKLAGGLNDAQKLAGVSPWYGQCTSMRQYPTRGFNCTGSEAYINNFRWEGPLLGVVRNALTVTNVAPDGVSAYWPYGNGRSRFTFTGAGPIKGDMLRVTRGGRLVLFEAQITEVGSGYFNVDIGNITNGGGLINTATDTFEAVYRAAEFIPTSRPTGDSGVGGADGISLSGWGAANMRGRLTNGVNPAYTFTMVGFENLNLRDCHGLSFDRCYVYHDFKAFNSSLEFSGCGVDCQTPTVFVNCDVNVRTSFSNEEQEYCGHADETDGTAARTYSASGPLRPIDPTRGGCSLFFFSGSAAGGLEVHGGRVHARKGMSFDGGLLLRWGARFVMNPPGQASPVHVRHTGSAAAIRLREDAVAYIEPRNVTCIDTTSELQLATGAAIIIGLEDGSDAGSFRDPLTWAGNFCRYSKTAAGYPVGDFSAVRSTAVFSTV